jgi:hypothetical protein
MLFFPVFAKLRPRPAPQAECSRLVLSSVPFSISFIETLCFQTLTHSFRQRRPRNPFLFNRFRTLSIATEVHPPLHFPLSLAAHEHTHCSILRIKPLRINTCKSVTKQTTLTISRINTYEKHGGRGVPPLFLPASLLQFTPLPLLSVGSILKVIHP